MAPVAGASPDTFPTSEVDAVVNRQVPGVPWAAPFPGLAGARPQSGSPPPFPLRDRSLSGGPPVFPGLAGARPQSGSPPRPAVPVFASMASSQVRHRTSSGSPPPFQSALWHGVLAGRSGREERPRFERDSQRTRSLEGRPGSRKHRRWTRSVEITSSLRRALAKCGEDPNVDTEALALNEVIERRPSAFYQLMENEGASRALEVLEAAEGAAARPRQPRQKDAMQIAEEHERKIRRTFSDTWQFLQGNEAARELLAKVEAEASRAFGPKEGTESNLIAALWMLDWDGDALQTKFGTPPANEMAIGGLNPSFRKVAHQLARSLGLHSESRVVDGPRGMEESKVIALRPPRRRCGEDADRGAWVPPPSVAQVLGRA
jgi:hypothetical protein